ncbi:hypothetical protein HPP92_009740 [Vanilla planifolia]|uniref:Uncharacterized protein n=1 Tax=Vanilla planifolia TaxID=51239 RepID=A0A835R4T5_VANPL|nr:hypothetical protein HPP92_009740 [Vanilla planifolia]
MELVLQDDSRYMFEPFLCWQNQAMDHGASVLHSVMSESSSSSLQRKTTAVFMQGSSSVASSDVGKGLLEGAEHEKKGCESSLFLWMD